MSVCSTQKQRLSISIKLLVNFSIPPWDKYTYSPQHNGYQGSRFKVLYYLNKESKDVQFKVH